MFRRDEGIDAVGISDHTWYHRDLLGASFENSVTGYFMPKITEMAPEVWEIGGTAVLQRNDERWVVIETTALEHHCNNK